MRERCMKRRILLSEDGVSDESFLIEYRREIFVEPEAVVVSGLFSYGNLTINMVFSGQQRLDGFCGEFDEELWTALLDHATVYTKDDIRFTFKVGDEVKVTG